MEQSDGPDETRFLDVDIEDEEDGARRVGRPSDYSPDLADKICASVASGSSLRKVCRQAWAPHHKTIFRWFRKYPEFLRMYETATEIRSDYFAEDMIDISDDDEDDIGFKESEDKDGKGAKPFIKIDNIHRARLRIQTRQWICERMKPRKYGSFQRQEITGKDGSPLGMSLREITDDQLQKRIEDLNAKLGYGPKETP